MMTYVDGCEYTWGEFWFPNHVKIEVRDADGQMVATAHIEEDIEQIFIDWYCEGDEIEEGEFPYFEYTDDEELVRWMVSTHPG